MRELIRKPRPLAVNNVALLAPLRSVQFSSVRSIQFSVQTGRRFISVQPSPGRNNVVDPLRSVQFNPSVRAYFSVRLLLAHTRSVRFSSALDVSSRFQLSKPSPMALRR